MVICDGSPTGLGGGLFQKKEHGYQPVHFVSRSLTDTKKRYSQIEREALAAEFTTTRLHMYLMGAQHFQLATDHKPLLPLFNNPNAKLPPRIERMVMKMQNLYFTAIHIPGKSNMTDYLSRHPLPEVEKTSHERHVRAVIEIDHAVVMETIQSETKDDRALQKLKKALETGKWTRNDPDLAPYYDLRAEIYVSEGIPLRLNRIIPPESLRNKTATIANQEGIEIHEATYDMLQAYRDTPHPATKMTPYELMMNREVRTKIEHFPLETSLKDQEVRRNDRNYKERIKQCHDERYRVTQLQLGSRTSSHHQTRKETES